MFLFMDLDHPNDRGRQRPEAKFYIIFHSVHWQTATALNQLINKLVLSFMMFPLLA